MTNPLSPLEKAIVKVVASENWPGFRIDGLVVIKRENTGVGRYTTLKDKFNQPLTDGTYGPKWRLLKIGGVKAGFVFVLDVAGGCINYIEIAVCGDEAWDGNEREWKIELDTPTTSPDVY